MIERERENLPKQVVCEKERGSSGDSRWRIEEGAEWLCRLHMLNSGEIK
jgi:hypothetical protein